MPPLVTTESTHDQRLSTLGLATIQYRVREDIDNTRLPRKSMVLIPYLY